MKKLVFLPLLAATLILNPEALLGQEVVTEQEALLPAVSVEELNAQVRSAKTQAELQLPLQQLTDLAVTDPKAAFTLGEVYRKGTAMIPQDVAAALPRYNFAGQGGNALAWMILGDLHSKPENNLDESAVSEFYKRAADAGNGLAAFKLGELYRSGLRGLPIDQEKANELYEQALTNGYLDAAVRLGKQYIRGDFGLEKQARGIQLLKDAAKEEVRGARTALSSAYAFGLGVPKDPNAALAILNEGVMAGDVPAGRELIRLLTEGSVEGIPRSVDRAKDVYGSIETNMDDRARAFEQAMLVAAEGASTGKFAALGDALAQLDKRDMPLALARLYSLNRNAYVLGLQVNLAERGHYKGSLNGLLTASTIRAVNATCRELELGTKCIQGPLASQTRRELSKAMFPTS